VAREFGGVGVLMMRRGAIALIDVLGFKGIWRRHSEEAVVRSLQALLEASQEDAQQATAGPENMIDFISPVFLSDTVAFGLAAKPVAEVNATLETTGTSELVGPFDAGRLDSWTVWHMGNFLAHLMRRALMGEVPFAFRGAVAFGRFGMTDRFLIGEAVDEAATFHERADGAIVGFAPSAALFEQAAIPSSVSKFIKYSIPTKRRDGASAGTWDTWAVIPWGELDGPTVDLIDLFSRTLVTDDPDLREEVDRKRENTLAFLRFAADAAAAPLREMLRRAADPGGFLPRS
jgi:hypothetical protein